MYRIDIHEIENGRRLTWAFASSDSGFLQRSDLAEELIRYMPGKNHDYYVVEFEINEDGSEQLLNKYRV